jgi:hypothetical protein
MVVALSTGQAAFYRQRTASGKSAADFSYACDKWDDEVNEPAVQYVTEMLNMTYVVEHEITKIEQGSHDIRPVLAAIDNHDLHAHSFTYVPCYGSGSYIAQEVRRWRDAVEGGVNRLLPLLDRLFSQLGAAADALERTGNSIRALRTQFDTTTRPPADVEAQFTRLGDQFRTEEANCATYYLEKLKIRGRSWDPSGTERKISRIRNQVAVWARIEELDRLRFEYAVRKIECPLPRSFSRGKRSRYVSNRQLNQGDYSWAIVPDEMLAKIDQVYDDMRGSGYPVRLNSFYRNPRHNEQVGGDPKSQHMYGRAVDFQTFDYDRSGAVEVDDWSTLRSFVIEQNPTSIEGVAQSGVGHVHGQWKNLII